MENPADGRQKGRILRASSRANDGLAMAFSLLISFISLLAGSLVVSIKDNKKIVKRQQDGMYGCTYLPVCTRTHTNAHESSPIEAAPQHSRTIPARNPNVH